MEKKTSKKPNDVSNGWINQWLDEKKKYERLGKPLRDLNDRIIRHKASLMLGRNFGEKPDVYLKRKGLTKYYHWSLPKEQEKMNDGVQKLNNIIKKAKMMKKKKGSSALTKKKKKKG